jgi:hypothetical protein
MVKMAKAEIFVYYKIDKERSEDKLTRINIDDFIAAE